MIRVLLPELILLPFLFALVALFAVAVYYAARRSPAEAGKSAARIYRCSACGHVYVDSRDVPLARCPRCACLNEAVKR